MASNTNTLFTDTTINPLLPDEVISIREPKTFTATQSNSDASDALASDFLNHSENQYEDFIKTEDDDLPHSYMTDDTLPLPQTNPEPFEAYQEEQVETDADRLEHITQDSLEVLINVDTVLPPLIHPSRLTVDRQKLTIVHRTFFGSTDTVSVQMDDINNVEAFVGPMFGEIRIYSKYFINNVQKLGGLWRQDAIAVRRLVQGYMIAHNKGIDCSAVEKQQLVKLLTDLGRGSR